MPLFESKFDQQKIDSIKRSLQREADKNHPRDYEIMVDGIKVVPRTNDIKEFEDYEQEVTQDTANVSILIYDGPTTNRNNRHSFMLQGVPVTKTPPQNGLGEIDLVVAQKLEEREREHEVVALKEKLGKAKEQLQEAEEYADSLEKRIKEMEEKRYVNAVSLGELASVVLKGIVSQHAARIPGGQALAGLLGADITTNNTVAQESPVEATASFEKQNEETAVSEQTRHRLALIAQMQQQFSEEQMIAVFAILDFLTLTPDKIPAVISFLGIQTEPPAH